MLILKKLFSRRGLIIALWCVFFLSSLNCCGSDEGKLWGEKPAGEDVELQSKVFDPKTFVKLSEEIKPAVVNLSMVKTLKNHPRRFRNFSRRWGPFDEFFERFFGELPHKELKQRSLGSGFIISKDGYILTNFHVVEDVDEIEVTLSDKEKFRANVIGTDRKLDIALIKIDSWKSFPIAPLADSNKLQVGEWVMAIGNPFGLGHTVTVGIVSAKGRVLGTGPYDDYIQTDASINPGNSGGPLFNLNGEVIGINTVIISEGQGIGFAIPINLVKDVLEDLRDKGKVERGWLGVMIQKVTPELAKSFGLDEDKGALVAEVVLGSPAEKAGVRRGDIILSFDGDEVDDPSELSHLAAKAKPGEKVELVVLRDKERKVLQIEMALYPKDEELLLARKDFGRLGIKVQALTATLKEKFGISANEGVVITEVGPKSPAEKAGIEEGEVILEINRRQIKSVKDYEAAMEKAEDTVLLLLHKGTSTHFIAVKLK